VAALNDLEGKIVSMLAHKHRHQEELKFLKQINRETPAGVELHLMAAATHTQAAVQKWLAKHKRFHMHYTPTSASWMNLVERFFRDLTVDVVRERSFTHIKELWHQILAWQAAKERASNALRLERQGEGDPPQDSPGQARADCITI
jgi:transposase